VSALLLLLAVAAVVATPAAGRVVQLTPVKVAVLPLEPTAQAMYAKHRGMFRKQGIVAELKILTDPTQTVATLLAGDADFVSTHVGLVASLKSRSAPVKVVAAGATYDPKKANSSLLAAPGKAITRARDLVGKTIAIDGPNTIAHLGVLKWLKVNGVAEDDVKIQYVPFPLMIGPFIDGKFDAAFVPEPYRTQALEQGAKRIANPFQAVCTKVCVLTFWLARANVDPNVAARFRNAIQSAAVWANQDKNDEVSGKILAKYAPINAAVIKKMTRTTFSTRLRVSLAQPWLDVFAEYGVIPSSFKPIDLVR
jgi:NitT/TauT family transport system substrate-binding protein